MPQPICPKCSREYVKRVSRLGFKERLLSIIYVYPFRCQLCRHRFRVMQWRVNYVRVEEDRREYDRMPISFPVSFVADSINGNGSAANISMNGCSVQAKGELTEGSIMRMALQISGESLPVNVEAAVVRTVQKNRIGIEFLRFQEKDRERLQLFVRGLLLSRND